MKFSWRSLLLALIFSFPFFVFAEEYQALQPVKTPGGGKLYDNNILQYLANIYTFAIAIAGGLAVIRIVYSGIKYMLTDIVTAKGEARKEIEAAVYGLLVAICSFVFLNTLNPNLVKFNLFIPQSQQMEGDGRDLINGQQINSTVSNGKASTPGVNNAPRTIGAEINPTLPDNYIEPNSIDTSGDNDRSVLPPRETPYVPPGGGSVDTSGADGLAGFDDKGNALDENGKIIP
jgi:hypothetical protein